MVGVADLRIPLSVPKPAANPQALSPIKNAETVLELAASDSPWTRHEHGEVSGHLF
jgi:hypothetical protein